MAMQLYCPHGNAINAKRGIGVVYYLHSDDQTPCPLMNKFATSAETVLKTRVDVLLATEADDAVIDNATAVALKSVLLARKKVYKLMETRRDDDLTALYRLLDEACGLPTLIEEMVGYFGLVAYTNVEYLFGSAGVGRTTLRQAELFAMRAKPTMTVQDFKAEDLNRQLNVGAQNLADQINQILEREQEARRGALEEARKVIAHG